MKMGTAAEGNCFSSLREHKKLHTRRVTRNNIFISIQHRTETETQQPAHFAVVRNQFQLMNFVQVVRGGGGDHLAWLNLIRRIEHRPFGALGVGKFHLSLS